MHRLEPPTVAYVPAVQLVHADVPDATSLYLPTAHAVHADVPAMTAL